MAMIPVLGYWNTRCLGQPIRLLLQYVGAEYEDKRYDGPETIAKKSQELQEAWLNPGKADHEWFRIKYSIGLDFPNLPYYIDDEVKLTQTMSILYYLGAKHDLVGSGLKEMTQVRMLESEVMDLYYAFVDVAYDKEFEVKKDTQFIPLAKPKLELWSKHLKDRKYAMGDKVTTVDFLLYETLDVIKTFQASLINNHESLSKYLDCFEEIPRIKSYMQSKDFIRSPIFSKYATFGNK